jgi:hypothetical protein
MVFLFRTVGNRICPIRASYPQVFASHALKKLQLFHFETFYAGEDEYLRG